MNASLFLQFITKYMKLVVGKITEKFNDKSSEQVLLHKTMLTEEYSADLTWNATEISHSIVAADVVALDSSLPLKKRGSLSHATGSIPKLGMKYRKGEKDITDINTMISRGTDEATIASKIFDDTSKAIKGIDIRTEIMFLQALSTGCTVIEDDQNTGTGIRMDFGYLAANTFHATTVWGGSGYTPQSDIQKMFDKATEDGNTISHVYMSKKYFDLFRKSTEGKLLAATAASMVITNSSLLPVPTVSNFLEALKDEFSAEFHIINSSFRVEKKDGTYETVTPFAEANVIGTPSNVVGRLFYGTLAEETNPVANVNYEKSGSHILVSKYSKTDPLEEFTTSQALCVPVIDGADAIYMLHCDSTGTLSVDPTTMTFDATKSSKKATIHTDGNLDSLSITSSETFCTFKRSKNVLTVECAANASTQRTATVTITQGTESVTIAVTQSAASV